MYIFCSNIIQLFPSYAAVRKGEDTFRSFLPKLLAAKKGHIDSEAEVTFFIGGDIE